MTSFIIRRLLGAIPILIAITIINFTFLHLAPGDPITAMYERDLSSGTASQEVIDRQRARFGLDQPVWLQYLNWVGNVARGNLGPSISKGRSVAEILGERIGPTLLLTGTALVISVVVGVLAGTVSALRRNTWIDYTVTISALSAISIPNFFLALVVIYIFALKLDWLPAGNMLTLGREFSIGDLVAHLVLPSLILGLDSTASVARFVRASVLEQVRLDYVRTAQSKGLPRIRVIVKHVGRNSLFAILTLIGLRIPSLIGGSVIVEQVFNWPGLGTMAVDAIFSNDYLLLMGFNTVSAVLVLLANLGTDVAYAVVDPRIRYD